jgi:hypothetical protein
LTQQCFNAISFVITAVQEYNEVFDNILVLMERISAFLDNLRLHIVNKSDEEEKLDKGLRSTVYRVLEHFLTILAHSHRLTKGWKAKLKLAVKVGAFGDDTGIKNALAELEKLIVDVTRAEITSIVVNLSKAAQDIRSLVGNVEKIANVSDSMNASVKILETSVKKSQNDNEEKERHEQIRKALSISGPEVWVERHTKFNGRAVVGTGKWLYDNPIFKRWAGLEPGSGANAKDELPVTRMQTDLLTIRAEKGYGKSHVSSIVIENLLQSYARNPKVAVGYYYFERADQKNRAAEGAVENRGSDETTTTNAINEGMRAIIYQLASAKSSLGKDFAKSVQKACSNKQGGFGKTIQLWNELIANLRKGLDGTFFIVLDGIDKSEFDSESGSPLVSIIREVMNPVEPSGLKVRLLVTGRQDAFSFLDRSDVVAPPMINVSKQDSSLNENDLKLFAEERLNDMEVFRDEALSDLKKRAIIELVKGAKGDFKALDLKLSKINQCRSPREVEKELTFAGEGKEEGIEREIKWLNLTLKEEVRVHFMMRKLRTAMRKNFSTMSQL